MSACPCLLFPDRPIASAQLTGAWPVGKEYVNQNWPAHMSYATVRYIRIASLIFQLFRQLFGQIRCHFNFSSSIETLSDVLYNACI